MRVVVYDDEETHDRRGERKSAYERSEEKANDEDEVGVDGWGTITRVLRRDAR